MDGKFVSVEKKPFKPAASMLKNKLLCSLEVMNHKNNRNRLDGPSISPPGRKRCPRIKHDADTYFGPLLVDTRALNSIHHLFPIGRNPYNGN